jgi:general secretion pathway protein K
MTRCFPPGWRKQDLVPNLGKPGVSFFSSGEPGTINKGLVILRPPRADEESLFRHPPSATRNPKSGSALIVALWTLIILSLLISAFAFDMHVEAGITSYYRKRLRAQYLAYAGVEYAKVILSKDSVKDETLAEDEAEVNNFRKTLEVGGEVDVNHTLGAGTLKVHIKPETSKWDVNKISDEVWKEILLSSGVPEGKKVDELIDCFRDYTDDNGDLHRLNGAESDDPFYEQRGYQCKNGPIDSVDELLRIKGFTPAIVYGGPPLEEDGEDLKGIADVLTVWGNGDKIDAMSSSEKALNGILDLNPDEIRRLIESRANADGELPKSLQDLLANAGIPGDFDKLLNWGKPACIEITSVGEVQGVRSTVLCTLQVQDKKTIPLAWREGDLP